MLCTAWQPLNHRGIGTTMISFWRMGIGNLEDYNFIYIGLPVADPFGLVANVIVANAPQLLVSLLYVVYNALLTTFLVQRELSQMYGHRKRLRVSEPVGEQRSSYPVSLPFKYGLPLQASSAAMNWLISQSLFLARITALNPDGSVDQAHSFSTCGYSPMAAIFGKRPVSLVAVECTKRTVRSRYQPQPYSPFSFFSSSLSACPSSSITGRCHW